MGRRRRKGPARRLLAAAGYELVRTGGSAPAEPLSHGEPPSAAPCPILDALPDDELRRLNELLPWAAFVVDGRGRRFGKPFSPVKRNTPQAVPDRRLVTWNDRTPLRDRTLLEVGCFEGLHTITLCRLGARVTAIDARIENVVKTLARCALFGVWPRVAYWNLEGPPPPELELGWDLVHHIGVLYHLSDPLSHLQRLAEWTRHELLLDTHVAPAGKPTEELRAGGQTVRCWLFREAPREVPFAGMTPTARWIVEEDLLAVLRELGFREVEVGERRDEPNGPRVLLYARR